VLYREIQLALRDEVAGQTLDDLLTREGELGKSLHDRVAATIEAFGVKLEEVGLRT
jgi:regulator of protease activity HflC (stomatin/prohibitin superfamily)